MKRIVRMMVFSAIALYVTSIWNKGFILQYDPINIFKAAFLVGIVYYLLAPVLKALLLPLNIITFGLASVIAYIALFYFVITRFSIVQIHDWQFSGLKVLSFSIPPIQLSYWTNLVVSSFSVSTIINLLELFL